MNFADSSLTETRSWTDVNQFVVKYFVEHPDPDPLPPPLTEIDVRLYGNGAWVSYEQIDPARGRKREARLLERVDGQPHPRPRPRNPMPVLPLSTRSALLAEP